MTEGARLRRGCSGNHRRTWPRRRPVDLVADRTAASLKRRAPPTHSRTPARPPAREPPDTAPAPRGTTPRPRWRTGHSPCRRPQPPPSGGHAARRPPDRDTALTPRHSTPPPFTPTSRPRCRKSLDRVLAARPGSCPACWFRATPPTGLPLHRTGGGEDATLDERPASGGPCTPDPVPGRRLRPGDDVPRRCPDGAQGRRRRTCGRPVTPQAGRHTHSPGVAGRRDRADPAGRVRDRATDSRVV